MGSGSRGHRRDPSTVDPASNVAGDDVLLPSAVHQVAMRESAEARLGDFLAGTVVIRERVPVREALGRVLAQDIVPAIDVPSHDNSAMDGYAVRFLDLGRCRLGSGDRRPLGLGDRGRLDGGRGLGQHDADHLGLVIAAQVGHVFGDASAQERDHENERDEPRCLSMHGNLLRNRQGISFTS